MQTLLAEDKVEPSPPAQAGKSPHRQDFSSLKSLKSKQKICKFTVVKGDPKQVVFEIYDLVPMSSRRKNLVRRIENSLASEVTGYRIEAVKTVASLQVEKQLHDLGKKKSPSIQFGVAAEESSTDYVGYDAFVSPLLPEIQGKLAMIDQLSKDLVQIRGVRTVIFVDKDGRAIYRRVNENSGSGFKTDSLKIGTIATRALLLFRTAQADDPNLGETQFVVVGRKEFKAIFVLIDQLEVILRVTVDKDLEARAVSDQVRDLIAKHYPGIRQPKLNNP
jgi:hypothetical protein